MYIIGSDLSPTLFTILLTPPFPGYRLLDALVKGLYPLQDTSDTNTLYSIAKAHDIVLPVFDEQAVADDVFSHPNQPGSSPDPSAISSTNISKESATDFQSTPQPVVEEKLVPLPRGPSHYIGPSSS